jgi:hypothetical protein
MSFEWIVQQKVFEALSGVISAPVYDNAPDETGFPYVTIGEAIANEWDTDNEIGQEVNFTINVWSRQDSSKETKLIQGEVYDALHLLRFVESGYHFTNNYFLSSTLFKNNDNITRQGVQEFKLTIEKVN